MGAGQNSFRTIVADPPWTPSLGATWKTRFTDKARPQKHYETLTVDEIIALEPPTAPQAPNTLLGELFMRAIRDARAALSPAKKDEADG